MKKYSKEWLLQDTISYYTLENRAVDCFEKCQYLTEDGKKCAIGRHLKPGREEELKSYSKVASVLINTEKFKHIIPDWFEKLPIEFIQSIQFLHDGESYWTDTGLSENGIERVKLICSEYDIDFNSLTINNNK